MGEAIGTPDGVLATYERVGERFARERNTSLFERAALERWLALAPGRRVLDVGCGPGEPIARHLVERGFAVTGVDGAATMVALFAKNFPGQRVIHHDMRTLALGERFDAILAFDSFFHLAPDDQRRTLKVLACHAVPGAALLFTAGPAAGEALGSVGGEPIYHASLSPQDYNRALADCGFRVVDVRLEDPQCDRHSLWLAVYDGSGAAHGDDPGNDPAVGGAKVGGGGTP